MKRSPKYGPRYGFKKFADGGSTEKPVTSKKPVSSSIEEFEKKAKEQWLKEEAARKAARAARDKEAAVKSAEKLKALEAEHAQADEDRKQREAYEKHKRYSKSELGRVFKKGGSVKKYARGGGIEIRGKTRGKFV